MNGATPASFDRQLRQSSWGWQAWSGALLITGVLFSLISSTSAILHREKDAPLPKLQFAYVPPPPAPASAEPPPPVSAILDDSLAFDPTEHAPLPEIPLDFLSVNIDPRVESDFAIRGDYRPQLDIAKPESKQPLVVFDHNQVDEKPVWLYGSMPRLPGALSRKNAEALVLYMVSDKGETSNIHILDSNFEEFNQPVADAIADWKFRPARIDGEIVRVWVQQYVRYDGASKSPFTL